MGPGNADRDRGAVRRHRDAGGALGDHSLRIEIFGSRSERAAPRAPRPSKYRRSPEVAPLIERRHDLVRRRERRDELVGMPVPDRRQQRQRRNVWLRIDRDIEIRLVAELVAGQKPSRPRGCRPIRSANPCRNDAASSAPRGALRRRLSELAPDRPAWHGRWRTTPPARRTDRAVPRSNSARRARARCAASHRATEHRGPRIEPRARQLLAEPGAHLGLGAAVERQRVVGTENAERQIGNAQPEPRAAVQRMRGQSAEMHRPSRDWCGRRAACAGT